MNITKALDIIRELAPEDFAADWDNCGVQVLGQAREVTKIAVTLDPLPQALAQGLDWGAELLVTHHPLYRQPVAPNAPGQFVDALRLLLPRGAWLYSAHTSLDARPNGPAHWLGRALGLENRRPLEVTLRQTPREVFFQAPSRVTEREAKPLLEAPGMLAISQSNSGEVRVVCEEHGWPEISERLKGIFAKEPEYLVRRLEAPVREIGFGEVGDLPAPLDFEAFAKALEKALYGVVTPTPVIPGGGLLWSESGKRPEKIARAAYCTGSGGSIIDRAFAAGADVYVTGDIKHHMAQETPGLILDIGHFLIEEEMTRLFAEEIAQAAKGQVEVRFIEGRNPFAYRVRA